MPTVSKIAVEYKSKGAGKVQKDNQRVQRSISKTSRKAKKEESTISDWMDKHKKGLMAIGAATAGIAAGILAASGDMAWGLGLVKLELTLLAMAITEELNPMLETLADLLGSAREAFEDLPKPVRGYIVKVFVLTTALGAAAAAQSALNAAVLANPYVLAGLAIAAFLALIWELETAYGETGETINNFLIPLLGLVGVIYLLEERFELFTRIGEGLQTVFGEVKTIFEGVWEVLEGFYAFTTGDGQEALELWEEGGGKIIEGFEGIITFFENIGDKIYTHISNFKDDIDDWFYDIGKDAIEGLEGIIDWFVNLPANILDSLEDIGFFSKFTTWGSDAAENLIDGIVQGIKNGLDAIKNAAGDMGEAVWENFSSTPNELGMKVSVDMIEGIGQGVQKNLKNVEMASSTIGQSLSPTSVPTTQTSNISNSTSVINISPGAIQIQGGGIDNNRELVEQIADELGRKVASR